MDKLRMETKDMTQENIKKLAELFPNVVTEMKDEDGNLKKGINFELLKQELSGDVIDGEEAYDFTWVGKRAAMVEANTPIRKTLRPCLDESKNWESTENLYIEGDNLDALKLLQESYLNSVKMIYIDPPYNTGNDSFVYPDDYTMDTEEYEEGIEYRDDEGNINFRQNNAANPRFHSDWCSMIYSRLRVAKNLLREDGAILMSIDDGEVDNLKKICNEVFGEENFVATFPWRKRTAKSDVPFGISQDYEWIVCYAKSELLVGGVPSTSRKYYESSDLPGRPWRIHDMTKQSRASERPNSFFEMVDPKTGKKYPANPNSVWRITKDTFQQYYNQNRIVFPGDYEFLRISKPVLRYFKDDDRQKGGDMFGYSAASTHFPKSVGMTQNGTKDLSSLFEERLFPFPKPVDLIKYLLSTCAPIDNEAIVLDFFAGSSTTAHAVMKLNAEDGGSRKFIMVQLPEETDEKSEAFKAGYKTIADIGKERIRRAGEKIKAELEEANAKLKDGEEPRKVPDIGFRVLKVDSTNMKDVYYAANEITQDQLFELKSNIKEDRTDLDLLYGVLVDWGLPLSLSHETETIEGVAVHTVDHGSLIACFAKDVPETVVREIAQRQPLRVVFRDSSFSSSPEKINVEEIFKRLAPNTSVRVI